MKIYRVGGSVRDELLGLPVQDRDWVVVGATPEQMTAQGFLPVGKDFPVFLHPKTREEYALARTERKTARGYKGFVIHTSAEVTLEEDLARRDLTINSIAIEDHSTLGNGQKDSESPANHLIYVQITRGVALRDHVMPADITPTVFVMASAMKLPTPEQRAKGVACVTADDFRWKKAHIKSVSLLGAVFARQISADAGAVETVMFRDGFLSEAAASNVWVVKDGVVMGPPKDHLVLEGIRYSLIENLCRAQDIPFMLRRISREEVLAADELLLSSATKEVLPITKLDGDLVGHGALRGKPGPVYARLYEAYQRAKLVQAI